MATYSVIGKPTPRIDSYDKVTGRAQYTADLKLPGMLFGKILRSPYAHARIRNIDISRAVKLPGVKAVVTGKDILPRKYGAVPFAADQYGLCIDKVRYVGDEVAAVAAVDPDTAAEALDLIEVEYEVLPAVFDPLEAMQPGAPLIHEEIDSNVSAKYIKEFGDIAAGWRECDYVREDTFKTQGVGHAPLEPHAALASYDTNGKLTIWACKQVPFFIRRTLARTLGLDESKVRFIVPAVGGGFGGKVEMLAVDFCAALLSMRTGRPVKIVYTREESLTCTRGRHPMIVTIKTGVKKDGTLIAQHYKVIADGGAYNSTAPLVITLSGYFAMLPYRVPNLVFEGYHVYTNKQANGPMRGHGIPQIRFASESQLDMIAADLGLDPVEIRLKNALHAGEPHPAKLTIRSCGFSESITKAAGAVDWSRRESYQGSGQGVGIGCSAFACGVNNMSHIGSGAIIEVHRDGAVTLLTGACDIGQGSDSVLAQIAAEELGVCLEDIRVTSADTELTPLDPGTFGSGVTFRAGNAVRLAARSVKQKLLEVVAAKFQVRPEDLEARERRIYLRDDPEKGVSFAEAIKIYQYEDKPMPLIGRGFYHAPAKEPTSLLKEDGDISPAYSFGSQAAEVTVDKETGKVKVLKVITAHDSGFVINPLATEGQLDGAIACGLGQVFYEDFCWDKQTGQILNPTFLDYKIPTACEVPEMGMVHIETRDPEGPYGAKESGEGAQVFTAPAIANAIYNATGVRIKELPISPEKVLAALGNQEAQGGGIDGELAEV